jgi:ribosomal protein S12 methylthiotransferase
MKTKKARGKDISIITLGCSKNTVDSEVLMGQLQANQMNVNHEGKVTPDTTVVINTCGFIDNAKQESIDTILQYSRAKEEGLIDKLYVTGCLSERYKPDLEKEISNVEEYFGTRDLPLLLKSLGAEYKHELLGERSLTTPNHYAYLKIAEGCDRPCSFCAIPIMRGKHISKSIEDIVKEAHGLAKNGTKELILIAQELTYYGLDIYKKRRLADLLRKLNEVDGIDWIRLHYAYPSGFPMDVIDAIRECNKVCNYIDIPLQHISDKLLTSMRRGITADKTKNLMEAFRTKIPGIAIRTTLILGYPGETEEDFELLKEFVVETQFDRLGVFQYSHEENTHAFQLKDDVPALIKEERAAEIMELQRGISAQQNQNKIGTLQKVLVDRVEGDYFIGRTEFDSPEVDNEVMIHSKDQYLRIGDFAQIKITAAEDYDLIGELA